MTLEQFLITYAADIDPIKRELMTRLGRDFFDSQNELKTLIIAETLKIQRALLCRAYEALPNE